MNSWSLASHFQGTAWTSSGVTSTVPPANTSTPSDPLEIDLDGILSHASIDGKVDKGPERRDMSPQGSIRRLEYTINQQKEKIDDMVVEAAELNAVIATHVRVRKLLTSVSFATWMAISWVWISFYGQISPMSSLQESMSGIARKFSSDNTWYEFVQEGKEMMLDIQKRNREIAKLTTAIEAQNKAIEIQKDLSTLQEERIAMCNKDLEWMKKPHK